MERVEMVCKDNSGVGYTPDGAEMPMSHFLTEGRAYIGEMVNDGYELECRDDTGMVGRFDIDRFE